MANKQHLEILKTGVGAWNKWRDKNFIISPDLKGVNLYDADLDNLNLSGTDLREANLRGAHLANSDLRGANLNDANLRDANLTNSDLSGANLDDASLRDANLTGANLNGANLRGAHLINSDLTDAHLTGASLRAAYLLCTNLMGAALQNTDFTQAQLDRVIFADTDLSEAEGLVSVRHEGPSEIGIGTLYNSAGDIPEVFLRGCGLKDWEIEAAKLYSIDLTPGQASEILYKVHELRTNPAIQFHSCFISYSSKNHSFAENLYQKLQDIGVRCWFAPEDIKIGDKFRQRIDDAIRIHDKLLVILSEDSISSAWVEEEVESAIEREHREKRLVLFPVRLDDAVIDSDQAWAASLRRMRHIGDFSKWQDHDSYSKAFSRLLRDLKAESTS
jgi:uncharacterized protein YjbI with pentapeptide repeats